MDPIVPIGYGVVAAGGWSKQHTVVMKLFESPIVGEPPPDCKWFFVRSLPGRACGVRGFPL
jgi:hypothetical protein